MAWLFYRWAVFVDWLLRKEPEYVTVVTGSRDRSLRGKARIRARRNLR